MIENAQTEDKPAAIMAMSAAQMLQIFLLGAVIGLVVWALTLFLERYVFQALLCHGSQVTRCSLDTQYAEAAATIIAAGAGLYFLVKAQIFRPLLIALAAAASLWGIVGLTDLLPWYGVGLCTVGLYAAAYLLYAWIARMRAFWFVVIVFLVLVVTVRLIFSA